MTTVLDHAEPVARKQHQCCECGGAIGAGDRYIRQRNAGYDGLYVFKAHLLCWALIDWEWVGDESSTDWHEKQSELNEWWAAFVATFAPTPTTEDTNR